jgi:NADH dehydrogenase FAD-containing subunit
MKQLILAGVGHAHLMTLRNLPAFTRAGVSVTVVAPGDFHYYSGMGPGLLSGIYRPEETRFDVRKMTEARGGSFIQGTVDRIDAPNRRVILTDGRTLAYDLLSCNLGSEVIGLPGASPHLIPVKPIENLHRAGADIRSRLKEAPLRVAVIGAGPAGVELAGNLLRLGASAAHPLAVTLISRDNLLMRYSARARRLALASLRQRGATVLVRQIVRQVEASRIALEGGDPVAFDMAFNAAGIVPSSVFRPSGLPVSQDGGLRVNQYLQCVSDPVVFGGGDCIHFDPRPLDRVGVYAVRQGPVLCRNLMAALGGKSLSLEAFEPQSRYLSILNLGDGRGILAWRSLVLSGRFAFWFKDSIDRAFMRRFQKE